MTALKSAIAGAVLSALSTQAALPTNTIQPVDVGYTADAVMDKVEPILQAADNTEPHWYQKRTVWATIVGTALNIAAPLLTKYGLDVDAETQEWIISSCITIGTLWAGYLAWRAGRPGVKPLGTK